MTDFIGVVPTIAKALNKRGYIELTEVQYAMLDPSLASADALVTAQTGSGKTVAFGLALAPTLLNGGDRFGNAGAPLALAIAPTRELALQVKRELEWLYETTGAVVASCVGGMDIRNERRALERGAHIVVGTPGRICDHIRRNALDMTKLKAVVLDEADEMLDLGFREDLECILEAAPAERRTLMFSATVPREIAKLAKDYQRDAVRIATKAEAKQHGDIEYRALLVSPADRENAIINVLRYYEATSAIVFCSTRAAVNHLTARFNNRNFAVVALSGELSQNERTHALQAMRDGRARVCIATDVAARGIDLPGLDLVIHADLPTNPETLLHRSGRTGRAGRKGISALVVPVNARRRAERLLENARITATWARPPSAEDVMRRDDERVLADSAFHETLRDDEQLLAAQLLERHGAEMLAAAFIRLCRARYSAPEDLVEIALYDERRKGRDETRSPREPSPARRENFGESVWFSLSVGRKQNAEPRWLIPMLCRAGGITKAKIGAIRMQPEETFVEIAADAAQPFDEAIGPNKTLERGIRVNRVNGIPAFGKTPAYEKARAGSKQYRAKSDEIRSEKVQAKFKPRPRDDGSFAERDGFKDKRDPPPWKSKKGGGGKFAKTGADARAPKAQFSKKKPD
jgi:ATP-dependent RNA helicase DeaD